MDFTVASCLF